MLTQVLCLLSQLPWAHLSSDPAVVRKYHFHVAIDHFWLIVFCPISSTVIPCGGEDTVYLFPLWLNTLHFLVLCSMASCGSLGRVHLCSLLLQSYLSITFLLDWCELYSLSFNDTRSPFLRPQKRAVSVCSSGSRSLKVCSHKHSISCSLDGPCEELVTEASLCAPNWCHVLYLGKCGSDSISVQWTVIFKHNVWNTWSSLCWWVCDTLL